ncbi:hypothetical protein ACQY1Q_15545 [Tenacibaculum sp. TC6]|uniref:hypothetical protein n=1 Tax=Tenacibaculum sp. TC6 TaxID=3423223 RepID=UPI003D35BE7F
MKNSIKNLGTVLNKTTQQMINGGNAFCRANCWDENGATDLTKPECYRCLSHIL